MLLLVNCALSSRIAPLWVAWEASQRGHDAGLRPCSFEHHRVVNLDLVEMVALGLEELTALVDGRVDQRVAVAGEWHLRSDWS